jgi:RNA 2',3'-cyclic 3'-phosphodiesterase
MRLFTGISLPQDLIDDLTRLLDRLRPAAHVKWSPPYNLHITTKFIGEWPEERKQELVSTLQKLPGRNPIDIAIDGLDWLPNSKSPRIFFAGLKAGPELKELADDTDKALAGLDIPRETRPFRPHLTLARINDSAVPLDPLRSAIRGLESQEFGRFTVSNFHLYLSKPGPAGSIYTQLAEFPFSK